VPDRSASDATDGFCVDEDVRSRGQHCTYMDSTFYLRWFNISPVLIQHFMYKLLKWHLENVGIGQKNVDFLGFFA